MRWLRKFLRIDDPPVIKPDLDDDEISRIWRIKEQAKRTGVGPGYFRGRWYGDYVEEVKQLRRERRFAEAEEILWGCVAAAQAEAKLEKSNVVPSWYSHQLLIIYREQRRYHEEVALLRRLISESSVDPGQNEYTKRLKRAESLLVKNPYSVPRK